MCSILDLVNELTLVLENQIKQLLCNVIEIVILSTNIISKKLYFIFFEHNYTYCSFEYG